MENINVIHSFVIGKGFTAKLTCIVWKNSPSHQSSYLTTLILQRGYRGFIGISLAGCYTVGGTFYFSASGLPSSGTC